MPKLKPEIKKLWCDALRSGEWQQTTEKLEWENTYCCLGVLTKLTGTPDDLVQDDEVPPLELAQTWWETPPTDSTHARNPLVKLAEIDKETDEPIGWLTLAQVNDELERTFAQIADLIEEQL